MSTSTRNLEDDHVHILKLIEVMEQISYSDDPGIDHLESIVDIVRNYADGIHHAKEENLFFPFLSERGFSSDHGPVAVMLNEHVQGRNFVKGISDNITLFKRGDKSVLDEIRRNINGYVELLRNHIGKENNILFRMADKVLSEADHIYLLEKFEEAERKHSLIATPQDYIDRIQRLALQYKV